MLNAAKVCRVAPTTGAKHAGSGPRRHNELKRPHRAIADGCLEPRGLVPLAGIEPARPCGQQILSVPRLPIPLIQCAVVPVSKLVYCGSVADE